MDNPSLRLSEVLDARSLICLLDLQLAVEMTTGPLADFHEIKGFL